MNALLIPLIVIAGAGLTLQAAMNAKLGRAIEQPIIAALVSFATGTLVLGVLSLLHFYGKPKSGALADVPWWAWLGGLVGAFFVATAAITVPKVGTGVLFCSAVCGQVVFSILMDHFGWLGVPRSPATAWRVAGGLLVIVGVLLVQRR